MALARRYLPAVLEARQGAAETVPHLDAQAVRHLVDAVRAPDRRPKRPVHRHPLRRHTQGLRGPGAAPHRPGACGHGLCFRILGGKPGVVGFSASLVAHLNQYAYGWVIQREDRFSPITSGRVHQILTATAEAAGIVVPDEVGAVHVLRHSWSIARPEATGNPRSWRTISATSRPG